MRTNTLQCEDCKHELIEHDPTADSVGGQEKMQAFNIATQAIRDALRRLEGLTLPSFNIMAWIAQNVVAEVVGVEKVDGEEQKVQVVIGGEEKDMLEKERLQEAQRYVSFASLSMRIADAETGYRTHYQSGTHILQSLAQRLPWVYRMKLASKRHKLSHAEQQVKTMMTRMICSKRILPIWTTTMARIRLRTSRQCQMSSRRIFYR